MNKVSILAVMALVAVGCNKRPLEQLVVPVMPDATAPIAFGAVTNVELTPSKATSALPTDTHLGVYAFKAATVPASAATAPAALWSNANNLEYTWNSAVSVFKENASSPQLFWPASGTPNSNLSFASYFPYSSTAVSNYALTQDLADQTAAPDYAFAWAKLEDIARPNPIVSQELAFNYKVAKLTFAIVGDGDVSSDGISMQEGATGTGIVSISVYGASTGFYKTYKLDLLTGTPSGDGVLNASTKMSLKGTDKPDAGSGAFVEAIGYVAPSTDAGLKTDGITVEIVYHDGTSAQTYAATIKTTDTLTGDAALANGLEAGKNYKYTLKLGKSEVTFTGQVTDWNEVDGGDIELQ